MPFGLICVSEEYQQRIHEALDDLEGIHVYVGDILVCGNGDMMEEATQDHDRKIRLLFERLRQQKIKLNSEKTQFKQNKIAYMGHIIIDRGVAIDDNKVEAI